jgi:apolipoprotein N-acyltransferase
MRMNIRTRAALLALATLTLAFANGQSAQPAASWLGPALLLAGLHGSVGWRSGLLGFGCYLAAWLFAWSGVFRLGPAALAIPAFVLSGLGYLPYLLHRRFAPRLPLAAAVFVFPAAATSIEYLVTLISPFGAWGLIAYSQAEWLAIAQLAALTGALGITFLMSCGSSLAALILFRRREPRAWAVVGAYAAMLALFLLGGAFRMSQAPVGPTLRVAMPIPHLQQNQNYRAELAPAILDRLLASSRLAAERGARLIVWPEDSLFIPADAEPALRARVAEIAVRSGAYIGATYGVRLEPGQLRYRNRSILIGPDGRTAWVYDKSFPVPGYEESHMDRGDGRMARVATPFGTLAGAICFDGDHDAMSAQTSDAGLVLMPSDDWPAIHRLHARMAILRAIERGRPLVRPAINGEALIADFTGRRVVSADSLKVAGQVLFGDVALAGGRTVYDRFGPVIGWASPLLLLLLILAPFVRRR